MPNQKELLLSEQFERSIEYVKSLVNIDIRLNHFDWHTKLKEMGAASAIQGLWALLRPAISGDARSSGTGITCGTISYVRQWHHILLEPDSPSNSLSLSLSLSLVCVCVCVTNTGWRWCKRASNKHPRAIRPRTWMPSRLLSPRILTSYTRDERLRSRVNPTAAVRPASFDSTVLTRSIEPMSPTFVRRCQDSRLHCRD